MLKLLRHIPVFLLPNFKLTTYLMMENIVLRHQLSVLQRNAKRPRLRKLDKVFWIMVYRMFNLWKESLVIVRPETVIRWNREGFRLFWKLKSKAPKSGRKRISSEIRKLVLTMANMNIFWGAPKIHDELKRLGIEIAESDCLKHYQASNKTTVADLENISKKPYGLFGRDRLFHSSNCYIYNSVCYGCSQS